MTDLKSCPFCGSDAIMYRGIKSGYRIQCTNMDCKNSTARLLDKEEAIRKWNRRADDTLAIVNGWLDGERYACDLSKEE